MRNRILLLLIPLFVLAGCRKDNPLLYSGFEMGRMSGGTLTTDAGMELIVTDNPANLDIRTDRRVLAGYQVLSVADDTYRIRLDELWETVCIDPVPAGDPATLVTDSPLQVDDAWFSGGYLNVRVTYDATDPSLHGFPLSFHAGPEQVSLRIFHDNRDTGAAAGSGSVVQTCLCYPMDAVTKAYRDAVGTATSENRVPILFQWLWYDEDTSSPQPRLYSQEGTYFP